MGAYDKNVLKAVFLAGVGGSGKGKIATAMFADAGLKVVNTDDAFEKALKAGGIPMSKAGENPNLYLWAATKRDSQFAQYAKGKLGMVIDSTAKNPKRIASMVRELRDAGYDCHMVIVRAPLDVALKRNDARGSKGGRLVPPDDIRDASGKLEAAIPEYRDLFGPGRLTIVNNDVDLSDAEFRDKVAPKLLKIGRGIVAKPLANRVGKQWLAHAKSPEPTTGPSGHDKSWSAVAKAYGMEEDADDDAFGRGRAPVWRYADPVPSKFKGGMVLRRSDGWWLVRRESVGWRLYRGGRATLVTDLSERSAKWSKSLAVRWADDWIRYDLEEIAPPGFSGTVARMRKHDLRNCFSLAWAMWRKGAKPHKKPLKKSDKYVTPVTYYARHG